MIITVLKRLLGSEQKREQSIDVEPDIRSIPHPPLSNAGIIRLLKNEHEITIESVFRLHKIMEKMGIIEKTGSSWLLTEEGRIRYTSWNSRVFNPDFWDYTIVKDIADYIHANQIDSSKINRKW